MNSAKFTWEKYAAQVGFSLWECWDMTTNRPKPEFEEVGRCSAKTLVVRPRDAGEGVMLRHRESGDEFWLHAVSDDTMGLRPRN